MLWKKNKLFATLTKKEFNSIVNLLEKVNFRKGDYLMREEESGDCFYLIERGHVSVYKEDERFVVAKLGSGDSVGLMAVIDDSERSASVKATSNVTAYRIYAKEFNQLCEMGKSETYYKIINNYLALQQSYLREANVSTVKALKKELEAAHKTLSIGSLFAVTIISLSLYVLVARFILEDVKLLSTSTFVTSAILLIMTINLGIYIKFSGLNLREYGLNLKKWKKALFESITWSLILIAIGTFMKWIFITYYPDIYSAPLFEMKIFEANGNSALLIIFIYAVFCILQEFIFRGVVQGSLQHLLIGKYIYLRAILLSTLVFSISHIHLPSPIFPVTVILPSLFWGILYARHDTLLGVSISHIMIGVWVIGILGVPYIA